MARRRGGAFVAGLLIGLLLFIGLLVGGGLFCYYKLNIKQIERWTHTEVPVGNEDFKNLPVKDLIQVFSSVLNGSDSMTIGKLEDDYGITLPDSVGGLNIATLKSVIRDCRLTDFAGIVDTVTAKMSLGEVIELTGSDPDEMSSLRAFRDYKIDDVLGKNGGKGFEGILAEVSVGDLIEVNDSSDPILKLLKDYTLLGDGANAVANMAKTLSVAALASFGIDLESNDMLRNLASRHQQDAAGNLLFTRGGTAGDYVFLAGGFYPYEKAEDGAETVGGQAVDLADFAILPLLEGNNLVRNEAGELVYRFGERLVTYAGEKDAFLDAEGKTVVFSGAALKAKTPTIAELGVTMNAMTLGELLGDNLPAALKGIADTRLDDLSSIGVDRIYLSDIVPEDAKEDELLYKLGHIVGKQSLPLFAGDDTLYETETYRDGETDLFLYEGVYYAKRAEGGYAPYDLGGRAPEPLSYTVAGIQDAVDELTLGDVLGKDNIPEALRAFEHTKIGEIGSELSTENIFLEDVAGENAAGVLRQLADKPGRKTIDLDGDGTAETAADLYRLLDENGKKRTDTVYYRVDGQFLYFEKQTNRYAPAAVQEESAYATLSYSVADIQLAVDELTLEEVLGAGKLPDMLEGFASVKIGELADRLTPANIYLEDVADKTRTDVLGKLAAKQGKRAIVLVPGDAAVTATLWRRVTGTDPETGKPILDKTTVYYRVGEVYYVNAGTAAAPDYRAVTEAYDYAPLSYSVEEIQSAVDELTLEEVLGEGNVPDLLASFAGVTVADLSVRLSPENIFLEDVAGEADGVLGALGRVPGRQDIDLVGDGRSVSARLFRKQTKLLADGTVTKDKSTTYYLVDGVYYYSQVVNKKIVYVRAPELVIDAEKEESYVTLSYAVGNLNRAIDELTLTDILGADNFPKVLASFAGVKVKDLAAELKVENIKLSDIVPDGAKEGDLLYDLAHIARTETVRLNETASLEAERLTLAEGEVVRDVWRHTETVQGPDGLTTEVTYYEKAGTYWRTVELTDAQVALLAPVCYSVAEIDRAVNELTVASFFVKEGEEVPGALKLVGLDTKLKDVPAKMTEAIMHADLASLYDAGLLSGTSITRDDLTKTLTVYDMTGNPTVYVLGDLSLQTMVEILLALAK